MRASSHLVVGGLFVLTAPILVLDYLPFTDFPQHLAIASILADPEAYASHYTLDLSHTLYVLPYALTLLVGAIIGIEPAYTLITWLSVLLPPLGVLAVLNARGRSPWLALLVAPLVYSRAVLWGFVNFNIALGLAFFTLALLLHRERTRRQQALLLVLSLASALTHVYGVLLVLAVLPLLALSPELRPRLRSLWPLAPLVLGLIAWAVIGSGAVGYGEVVNPTLTERWDTLEQDVVGPFQDSYESLFVLVALLASLALAWPFAGRKLDPFEKVVALTVLGNAVLFLVLPRHTLTAKCIHFRHAIIALLMLPMMGRLPTVSRDLRALRVGLSTLGLLVIGSAWYHLLAFNAEARDFDAIVDAAHDHPRVLGLILDRNGTVATTYPYLHFPAYIQARRGGAISVSFSKFWNVPVRLRDDIGFPELQPSFEWNPIFEDAENGFFDHVVLHAASDSVLQTTQAFPFALVARSGSWQLYRRVEALP